MRKLLIISFILTFIIKPNLSAIASEKDIVLECINKSGTIKKLTYNENPNIKYGKEWFGPAAGFFDVRKTEKDLLFEAKRDGVIVRSWYIDRYTGQAELFTKNEWEKDKIFKCEKVSKKF